jgi:uncharacterized protein YdaU (DUF1376 family)
MSKAWMPLYIGDYIADTGHLSTAEHGCYLLLIMHYWEHGSIPIEDDKLARICRCRSQDWSRYYKKTVLAFFHSSPCTGHPQVHLRIDAELQRLGEISSKRKGAALHMHSKRSASATQSHSQSHKIEKPKKVSLSACALPTTWQLDEQDAAYAQSKGWLPDRITAEAERFRDHALTKGRTAKNWHAAWRNWVTSPFQKPTNGAPSNGRSGSLLDETERFIQQNGGHEAARQYVPGSSGPEPLSLDFGARPNALRLVPKG